MKTRSLGHVQDTPIEQARQHLRHVRAKCDLLFTMLACSDGGTLDGLEDVTLPAYLSSMLDSCSALEVELMKLTQKSAA